MKDLFSGIGPEGDHVVPDPDDTAVWKMAHNHFMALQGSTLGYYGADAGEHTFNVDGVIFKVLEDPSDGYRSHLGVIDYSGDHNSIFFSTPIARVKIQTFDEWVGDKSGFGTNDEGYRLVDVDDGHTWLEFGTTNYDDYYPYFVFRHYPKEVK